MDDSGRGDAAADQPPGGWLPCLPWCLSSQRSLWTGGLGHDYVSPPNAGSSPCSSADSVGAFIPQLYSFWQSDRCRVSSMRRLPDRSCLRRWRRDAEIQAAVRVSSQEEMLFILWLTSGKKLLLSFMAMQAWTCRRWKKKRKKENWIWIPSIRRSSKDNSESGWIWLSLQPVFNSPPAEFFFPGEKPSCTSVDSLQITVSLTHHRWFSFVKRGCRMDGPDQSSFTTIIKSLF